VSARTRGREGVTGPPPRARMAPSDQPAIHVSTSGSSLADFTFVQKIGSGSFGTVHKVVRKVDNSEYVIKQVKILVMSRKEQETAINEVRILASLDSPHVIKYYDSFIDVDSLNIVMELASHGNLSDWLKRRRSQLVPETTIWKFFLQLVVGIHHIHERNIVHRDIKAANIMLDSQDNIKIGDLGVAKVLTTRLRAAHTGVGTPYYL
jgi:NIMA (never in mitosis gene a)-related kinase